MSALLIVTASIDIDAPIDVVWSAMTDLQRYREWNPFIVDVEDAPAHLQIGSRFQLRVRWANGKVSDSWETVTRLEPPTAGTNDGQQSALLAYEYSSWLARTGIVIASRDQSLSQAPGKPTRYHTREEFQGLLGRFVPFENIEDGFQRHAQALKQRAEAMVMTMAMVITTAASAAH